MIAFEGRVEGADLPTGEEVVSPALEAAMTEALMLLERAVKIRTPIGATETARGSIASEQRWGSAPGRGVPLLRGIVGSPQAHVAVLERGRKPGAKMPPPDALELWVRRKLKIQDVKEARSVAFVIARSIARKGTEAVRMFELAATENEDKVLRIFEKAGVHMAIRIAKDKPKKGGKKK